MAVTLAVKEREVRPRSTKEKLRKQGEVPAVLYGNNVPNTALTVSEKDLLKILRAHGKNTVITMTVGGKKVQSLVGEQQVDTFTKQWKHVDFVAVDMKEKIEVTAEVVLINDAKGAKSGGTLVQNVYELTVSATPDNLPEKIEVDVANLEIGDSITVADLSTELGYEIVDAPEEQVASVVVEQNEVEEESSATTEEAEPELVED
ncbi:50S ribosomal protein L25/general stress protein Ctc [Vagococcus entomophilus]|uniref:Large ribosomal subunit protein bL25 n=1 Tax=Vagococcus entomophilus TaxID=1160095 RepID=A0A430AGD6_9ENTE|nr:50S ribosomal protein L25/general stress protein Ctc [Vagococcus entomophilus]RSU06976.1 50S ribosomal protein L25/general stress protein Ctc [Vagococcus entomophilus]